MEMTPTKGGIMKDSLDEPRLNQPKPPSSAKDWEAMDIFVFCNGQQYSPPRKYHLKADELNWWQATLGHIARSQYGAIDALDRYSTIELYSIDGHKISSPVELRDGSPYVAVVPPDGFIDAGYEKYIIKASKSWEKRQSRFKSVKESTNSGQSKSKVSLEISEETDQNSNRDVYQSGSFQRRTIQGSSQQGNNSTTVILKQKRRPYSGSNRTSILRKLNNELKILPAVKKPAKRKDESVKDNVKVIIPLAGNFNDRNVKHGPALNKIGAKPRSPIKKTDTPALLHYSTPSVFEDDTHDKLLTNKNTDVTDPVVKRESRSFDGKEYIPENKEIIVLSKITAPADKKESTDNFEIENVLQDKEIIVISNPPRNEEDDLMYMFWNLNDVTQDKLPEPLIANELTIVQAVKETQTTDIVVKSITRASSPIQKPSRNNSKIETNQATQSEPITSDEPFIAVANNVDTINLKLNIELKDGGGVVSNVRANIVRRPHSSNDNDENENTIDIEEIIKESNSLKSLSDCDCECSKKHNNIYVLQCTCDDEQIINNNHRTYVQKIRHDDAQKTYLIVVPVVTVVENDSSRIRSEEKPKQSAEKEVQNDDEIVTVVNFMNGGQEMDYFPRYLPLPIEYKEMSTHDVTHVDCYAMPLDSEMAGTSSESTDASTQTEWCSIVLEVRRHEDGRYTFHLPPLQLLRTCNKDLK